MLSDATVLTVTVGKLRASGYFTEERIEQIERCAASESLGSLNDDYYEGERHRGVLKR